MAEKWYPVIDYTACAECGTCSSFCGHGVYDMTRKTLPMTPISPALPR